MENQNKAEITYSPIPEDVALIISGNRDKTLLNIGDCSFYVVLTKIICSTLSLRKKLGACILKCFQDCILSVYKYMDGWWKDKPSDITYRKIYTSMRDILLNKKTATIYSAFVLYANDYFKGSFEDESLDRGILRELIEQLKEEEEREAKIVQETDEIINILYNMQFDATVVRNLDPIKNRLQIDGRNDRSIVEIALFCYGYLEGVRTERAKKKRKTEQ